MKKSDKDNKIYYTYVHIRLDTNKVFYVGKGKLRRAKSKQHRNKYWNNVVNKCGYKVIFVKKNITEEESINLEIKLIKNYRDKGYKLTNLTDGGDGLSGYKYTDEQKIKLSNSLKETFKNIVPYMTGRFGDKHPNYGKKASLETRKRLSDSHKGKFLGAEHPKSRKIKYKNILFGCLADLAAYENISYSGLKKRIRNNSKWGYEILAWI